jgi:hypothetical protein
VRIFSIALIERSSATPSSLAKHNEITQLYILGHTPYSTRAFTS